MLSIEEHIYTDSIGRRWWEGSTADRINEMLEDEQPVEQLSINNNYGMRRVIKKDNLVKVVTNPDVYSDLEKIAKDLGSTAKYSPKFIPKLNDVGNVLGIDEGYVLVDFGTNECLIDVSCLEVQKKKEEILFLVKYPNNTLEEFETEDEVQSKMQDLYKSQSLKVGDLIKVYNVKGYREVKIKIEVAFT